MCGATNKLSDMASILECFDAALAKVPDKDFLRFREGPATYREFRGTYRRLASRLAGAGIGAGDIVPTFYPNSEAAVAVVRQPGVSLSGAQLRDYCTGQMARYMVPEHIRFLDSLPGTPTGKVAKAELKKLHTDLSHVAAAGQLVQDALKDFANEG